MFQGTANGQSLTRLTYSVFQSSEEGRSKHGRVVAMTSAARGEGVTYVARLLCREVSADHLGKTLYCTAGAIASAPLEHESDDLYVRSDAGYWILSSSKSCSSSSWAFNPSVRCARLEILRRRFDYIVLDCPAICEGGDMAGVAPLVDSILLVVAAGRSTKQQLAYAQQVISQSGGSLVGCVLNRRGYPIPPTIFRLLKGGSR